MIELKTCYLNCHTLLKKSYLKLGGLKMFNHKNRLFNQNTYQNNYCQGQPYNMMEYPTINQYDLSRYDEQINELKRIHNELLKRITRIENYLGIRTETEQSNYQ